MFCWSVVQWKPWVRGSGSRVLKLIQLWYTVHITKAFSLYSDLVASSMWAKHSREWRTGRGRVDSARMSEHIHVYIQYILIASTCTCMYMGGTYSIGDHYHTHYMFCFCKKKKRIVSSLKCSNMILRHTFNLAPVITLKAF